MRYEGSQGLAGFCWILVTGLENCATRHLFLSKVQIIIHFHVSSNIGLLRSISQARRLDGASLLQQRWQLALLRL
jgi:hypothetical protein